ncbi:protein of unknown function DUF3456 [Phytophthora cactorum]|nr:protein of unknown function DUF3456 [Phytophthora cactorum]
MKRAVLALPVAVVALLPVAFGWTERCGGTTPSASTPLAMRSSTVTGRASLYRAANDHDMDVVFRISEEKKQIKYSRSEARILEVLDDVCEQVPLELPDSNHKAKRMLSAACSDFVGEYEDELTRTFFDDFTPAKERMCGGTLQVCSQADKTVKHEDL